MNLTTFKILIWVGSLGLGGALAYVLFDAVQNRTEWRKFPSPDSLAAGITVPDIEEPERDDLVSEQDLKEAFYLPVPSARYLDWSGEPPPPPALEVIAQEDQVSASATPVEELLKVIFIQVQTWRPEKSFAYVKYIDSDLARSVKPAPGEEPTQTLFTGDHLPEPHANIFVERVHAEGVTFAFEDAERELETVQPGILEQNYDIVPVGPEGPTLPVSSVEIPYSHETWRPERTELIGTDRWLLGTEDVAEFGENYAEILTREVRHGRWRDPSTGRYAGVQLLEVEPGGLVASHGGKQGDVIKSINGDPVTSAQEAISYVKNNSEATTEWVVVVIRQGAEETMTFYSPPPE